MIGSRPKLTISNIFNAVRFIVLVVFVVILWWMEEFRALKFEYQFLLGLMLAIVMMSVIASISSWLRTVLRGNWQA
jgi:hypothetical protein